MPERVLIDNCAPTLAGLKTASLVSVCYEDKAQLHADVRRINRRLSRKGVRVIPLKYHAGRALLYVYRPALLKRDMAEPAVRQMLEEMGYTFTHPEGGVAQMAWKVAKEQTFPHEIGLFLGYPVEDVRGFIRHKGCDYKCAGYWKVYGDAEVAKRTFERYRRCTLTYRTVFLRGKSLEDLTVSM